MEPAAPVPQFPEDELPDMRDDWEKQLEAEQAAAQQGEELRPIGHYLRLLKKDIEQKCLLMFCRHVCKERNTLLFALSRSIHA